MRPENSSLGTDMIYNLSVLHFIIIILFHCYWHDKEWCQASCTDVKALGLSDVLFGAMDINSWISALHISRIPARFVFVLDITQSRHTRHTPSGVCVYVYITYTFVWSRHLFINHNHELLRGKDGWMDQSKTLYWFIISLIARLINPPGERERESVCVCVCVWGMM